MMSNEDKRKHYRYCFVPGCKSTTMSTPNKRFIMVPRKEPLRKKWLNMCRRLPVANSSVFYCCEDHFDLENDFSNVLKHRLTGCSLRLKEGVVPTKFDCQPDRKPAHSSKRKEIRKYPILNTMRRSSTCVRNDLEGLAKQSQTVISNQSLDSTLDSNGLMTTATPSGEVKPEPAIFITPDVDPPDLSEPGQSIRLQPDNTMMEKDASLRKYEISFINSERGGHLLEYENYLYRIERRKKDGNSYWKCASNAKCKARAVLSKDQFRNVFIKLHQSHCHDPDPGEIQRKKLAARLRERASAEVTVPVFKIYNEEVAEIETKHGVVSSIPSFSAAQKMMYRARSYNSKKIPEDDLGSESSLDSQLESNLTPIELVAKVEPTTFITPDDVYPPDLSASGPSNRLETDSFQMEQSIHQAMTCEFYPADVSPPDSLIKIKEEPIDPNAYKQDTLSANVRQKLTQLSKEASLTSNSGIYDQNILSENVRQELIQFSKEASVTSNQEGSLFQPPVLIKEELISSEDEL